MYEVTVETEFAAAHAILIRGEREPVHGHNWKVTVMLAGDRLDEDGLLVDFHQVEGALAEVVGRFRNRDLNQIPPFDRVNPTAERVAEHIGEEMVRRLGVMDREGRGVRVAMVRVTEAPGCAAVYRPARLVGR